MTFGIGPALDLTALPSDPLHKSDLFQLHPRCGKIKASLRSPLQIGGIENRERKGQQNPVEIISGIGGL